MNNPVSGESSARGFVGNSPHIAVDPAAVAIRRPENLDSGMAMPGEAMHGEA